MRIKVMIFRNNGAVTLSQASQADVLVSGYTHRGNILLEVSDTYIIQTTASLPTVFTRRRQEQGGCPGGR